MLPVPRHLGWLSGKCQISPVNLAAVVLAVEPDEQAAGIYCADDAVSASSTRRPVDDATSEVGLLGYYHWLSLFFRELVALLKHNLRTTQVKVEFGPPKRCGCRTAPTRPVYPQIEIEPFAKLTCLALSVDRQI